MAVPYTNERAHNVRPATLPALGPERSKAEEGVEQRLSPELKLEVQGTTEVHVWT